MDEQKQRVIDSLKGANNVLVTVRNSPTVDGLAACIALTLVVNELDKHGTAVFSGQVPSVLEFLEPERTLEKNTDSLRDFIISLDKSKADKLRYKVEDTVVKIYITPYRTSLSSEDLRFGQGDFNVDVVVALGVHEQDDLDEAITAHGRILHDATVISINTDQPANDTLGSIAWVDTEASSLSEMIAELITGLDSDKQLLDNQIATALLTGIVAETERFGNAKTKPATMETAAKLLTAGANQELVASKLSEPAKPAFAPDDRDDHDNDGSSNGSPATITTEPEAQEGNGELDIEHPSEETAVPPDFLARFPAVDDTAGYSLPPVASVEATEAADYPPVIPVGANTVPAFSVPRSLPVQDPERDPLSDAIHAAAGLQTRPMPVPAPPFEPPAAPFTIPSPDAIIPEQPAPANVSNEPPVVQPSLPPVIALTSPQMMPEPPAVSQQEEEQAALDYLRGRQVGGLVGTRIEPLGPAQAAVLGVPDAAGTVAPDNLPKISPAVSDEAGKVTPQTASTLDPTKFALTPPSLGGTLTANMPNDQDGSGSQAAASGAQPASPAPILKHDRPSLMPSAAQPAIPVPAPVPAPTPVTPVTPLAPPLQVTTPPVARPVVAPARTEPAPAPVVPPVAPQPAPVVVQQPQRMVTAVVAGTRPASMPAPYPQPAMNVKPPQPVNPAPATKQPGLQAALAEPEVATVPPVTKTAVTASAPAPKVPGPKLEAAPASAEPSVVRPTSSADTAAKPAVAPATAVGPAPKLEAAPAEHEAPQPEPKPQPVTAQAASVASGDRRPLEAGLLETQPVQTVDMPKPSLPVNTVPLPNPQVAARPLRPSAAPTTVPPPAPPPLVAPLTAPL